MNYIKAISVVILTVLLSACSYFYGEDGLVADTSYAYLKAEQGKEIVVPEGLKQENKIDYTVIPAIGEKAKVGPIGKDVDMSAPIQILAVIDNVRVNKQAKNPTVFVIESKDFLWDSVLDLFQSNQVVLSETDKPNHLIVTDWVALDKRGVWLGLAGQDDVEDFRAKYAIKFGKGVLRGESQLEVERVVAEKFDDDTDNWRSVPSFWEDSAEMLNKVIAHYDAMASARDKAARRNMIAGFKVELTKDQNDKAALVTSAPLDIVWEKLPKVLEALNFEVSDRDRRLMTYFTKYEYEEPGFFASLFDDDVEALPITSGEYQVTLRQLGENTAIVFRDGQGTALDSETMVKFYPTLSRLFGKKR